MFGDPWIDLAERIVTVARPSISGWVVDDPRSDRIQFDVAIAGESVARVSDQRGFETAFPKCPRPAISGVEASHVTPADRLHHARRCAGLGRRREQMHMIGHQDVGVQRATVLAGCFGEFLKVVAVVGIRCETRLPVDTALNDVQRDAGQVEARLAGYETGSRWAWYLLAR